MKCITNDNKLIIYINNKNSKFNDFENIEYIEENFKKLFLKLKDIYQIEIKGFYIIDVYIDEFYGMILELEEEEIDFIEYYDDTIDMTTSFHNVEFLYQVNDILDLYDSNLTFYLYNNKYYAKVNNNIDDILLSKLIENSNDIVYKNTELIIKRGKKI